LKGRPTFFRGSEFPRLLLLGAIGIAGWVGVWTYLNRATEPPPHQVAAAERTPLPPPDEHDELQGVVDKQALTVREHPGYLMLLDRVRNTPPEQLARESRRDVVFGQLLQNPKRYRGIPIHIDGTAFRVQEEFTEKSALYPKGVHYEAWIGNDDSRPLFWHIIFEDAPPHLPVGDQVDRRMIFDGYFFKLRAYPAGDKKVGLEPWLIGRVSYVAPPENVAKDEGPLWLADPRWLAIPGVIVVLGAVRWIFVMRSAGSRRVRVPFSELPRNDEIDPDALSKWVSEEGEADADS
jgi:hypothetical protein